MTILDKLMEKKDLLIYIDYRIKYLKMEREKLLKSSLPRVREELSEGIHGRILELKYLKKHVVDLKDTAKRYWLECAERDVG